VLLLDELTPGLPMRAKKEITSVGGKGMDASVVLSHLGAETVALAFVAGRTGVDLAGLLETYGIAPDLVWVEGETRVIYVLAESRTKRVSHVKRGELQIRPEHCHQFLQAYQQRLAESDWVICAGSIPASLPASLCGQLAQLAHDMGKPFLIDGCREVIHCTLPHNPTVVKMNIEEFEWTFAKVNTLGDLLTAGCRVRDKHRIRNLVISCGTRGIVAFTAGGIFHARAPEQEVVNCAGAGDAVSAAITLRLSQNADWPEALRWAAATAAAVVKTAGTADCRLDDVQALLRQVVVQQNPIFG
jgi:1-phosphofructokinase family hexose kinase